MTITDSPEAELQLPATRTHHLKLFDWRHCAATDCTLYLILAHFSSIGRLVLDGRARRLICNNARELVPSHLSVEYLSLTGFPTLSISRLVLNSRMESTIRSFEIVTAGGDDWAELGKLLLAITSVRHLYISPAMYITDHDLRLSKSYRPHPRM